MLGHVAALFLMCVASQTLKYTYVIPTYIISNIDPFTSNKNFTALNFKFHSCTDYAFRL